MNPPPSISSPQAAPREDAATDVLLSLAEALHEVGEPAHRVEATISRLAERLKERVQIFCLPTGLWLSIERGGAPRTYLRKTAGSAVNLERLTQLTIVANDLIRGRLSIDGAAARIELVRRAPDRYGRAATVAAYITSAAAFSVFFGGGPSDLWEAAAVGMAVGCVAVLLARIRRQSRLFELVAAGAAATVASLCDYFTHSFSGWIPLASGLIILLPGLALVDGVEELANGHLSAGASRLAGVAVQLLALAFGALIATTMLGWLPDPPNENTESLPPWAIIPALTLVSLGSMVRFRARPRDVGMILLASSVAYFGSYIGNHTLGELAGPFLAALALSTVGNLYARLSREESEIVVVPGLAVLVPGSVGFRSVASLALKDTAVGLEEGAHMVLVATALVAGLLVGNSIVKEPTPGA